jgi:transposase
VLADLLQENDLLKRQVESLVAELAGRDQTIRSLEHRLALLLKRLYGPRTEHIDPRQLLMAFPGTEEPPAPPPETAPDDEESVEPPRRKKKGHGRARLPDDLPRERVEHAPDPEELNCPACECERLRIGEEVTEELDYRPAVLFVRQHVRGKYACPKCEEGVVIAEVPPRPIEKGLPGPGLLAHVVVSKYADHLPLNRQEGIFARFGALLARSTMCDWIRAASEMLAPVVAVMKREILASGYVQSDDTPVMVRVKGEKKTHRGYLWVYHAPERGAVVYDFTMSRARDGPEKFLGGYRGYLQADAYSGYDGIFRSGAVKEVGCWAHARRKFYEALQTDPREASAVMAAIARLYEVEDQAKAFRMPPDAVRELRQTQSRPILETIREYLELDAPRALPQSPLGQAVTYARNQWSALTRYLEDGRLGPDNNPAERALRRVAVGRNNWIFCGSETGGERAAVLYSLVGTCKLQGIDPFAYLRDVFSRIATHRANRIDELTPRGWAAALAARQPVTTQAS